MREYEIENYLVQSVIKLGGICYKFQSPGRRGVPDRICVFPHREVAFVELKSPTGITTPKQDFEIREIKKRGHFAVVINSRPRVDAFISYMKKRISLRQRLKEVI